MLPAAKAATRRSKWDQPGTEAAVPGGNNVQPNVAPIPTMSMLHSSNPMIQPIPLSNLLAGLLHPSSSLVPIVAHPVTSTTICPTPVPNISPSAFVPTGLHQSTSNALPMLPIPLVSNPLLTAPLIPPPVIGPTLMANVGLPTQVPAPSPVQRNPIPIQRPATQSQAPSGAMEAAALAAARINASLLARAKLRNPALSSTMAVDLSKASFPAVGAAPTVTEMATTGVPLSCSNTLAMGQAQQIDKMTGLTILSHASQVSPEETMHLRAGSVNKHVLLCQTQDVNTALTALLPTPLLQPPMASTLPILNSIPPLPPAVIPTLSTAQPVHHPLQDKVFVGLDHAPAEFDIKARLEGPGGSYLQHISRETGARVVLRGKRSGFLEPASRREACEPLYCHVSHSNQEGLDAAKALCESLIQTIRAEFSHFQNQISAVPPMRNPYAGCLAYSGPDNAPAAAPVPLGSIPSTDASPSSQNAEPVVNKEFPPTPSPSVPPSLTSSGSVGFPHTAASSSATPAQLPRVAQKRRFTEEGRPNAGLLGYTHGPFHLTSSDKKRSPPSDSLPDTELMPPPTLFDNSGTVRIRTTDKEPPKKHSKTSLSKLGALVAYEEDEVEKRNNPSLNSLSPPRPAAMAKPFWMAP
uniref:KH homology domain-containing protein 4-like isoform X2 n=1 Tax=Myxine glutinosa TaxID=7769 RepID=UPI00358DDEA7